MKFLIFLASFCSSRWSVSLVGYNGLNSAILNVCFLEGNFLNFKKIIKIFTAFTDEFDFIVGTWLKKNEKWIIEKISIQFSMVDKLALLPFGLNFMALGFNNTLSVTMVVSPFGKNLMSVSGFEPSLAIFCSILEKALKYLPAFR